MIIGIDASRANRDHKTGTEWYSYYLIKWLAKIDNKNEYILYTDRPLAGGLTDLTKEKMDDSSSITEPDYDANGYQVIKSPGNNFRAAVLRWPFGFFWTQGRLSLEMLIRKPDVLFVPAHAIPLLHPKRSVVTIHDIGYETECVLYNSRQIGPQGRRGRKMVDILARFFTRGKYGANTLDYLRWSTDYSARKSDRIISVSEFTKGNLARIYKTKPEKITVVYNGYNKDLYKKIENQDEIGKILDKYGISRPYLLYVGRLEKKKNIPAFIEAYATLRERRKDINQKLVLVGDASYGYDEIKYIINEYDIHSEIVMTGWLPEEELPFLFNAADAFVFPSCHEGFGLPLLQAMACEVPIVASNAASLPEVAGEAAVFFDPGDLDSMVNAMAKALTDTELRKALIEKGRQRVKDFGWEKAARQTHRIITYS